MKFQSWVFLIVLGTAAGIAAVWIAPEQHAPEPASCALDRDCGPTESCAVAGSRRMCIATIESPPAVDLVRALSLGRHSAAADLIWLQVVQFVGSAKYQAVNFRGLGPWINLVTALDVDFSIAYFYAGALLPTSKGSAQDAEEILARGEKALGEQWEYAMWRGFVAYYGLLDPQAAAAQFERSARLGGPAYLVDRAKSLREQAKGCDAMQRELTLMRRNLGGNERSLLNDAQAQKIIVGCLESKLEAAIASYRVAHGESATTMDQLLKEGLLDQAPPAPHGQCWFLATHKAFLAPCIDGKRTDLPAYLLAPTTPPTPEVPDVAGH